MKVLQIIPDFPRGGAEAMCENLTYELIKNGINVTVVGLYDMHSAVSDRMERNGVRIRYLFKKPGPDISMLPKLYKLFKEERPDVVHTHRYAIEYVFPAAVLAGVPKIVHTFHSVAEHETSRGGRLLNKLYFRSRRVVPVALSQKVKETILDYYHLAADRVPVIYNGVPLDRCIQKENYTASDPFRILHVGRFSQEKNHEELLKAVNLLKQHGERVRLTLIGGGVLSDRLHELVETLGLQDQVCFLGEQDDVFPFLHEADAFVLPSLYEGMPMSLIEAMGTGLPIVASNVGGIPDMVEDGKSGLLCEPTPEDIAAYLEKLIHDQTLREQIGNQARKAASRFSSVQMAANYLAVYKNSNQEGV